MKRETDFLQAGFELKDLSVTGEFRGHAAVFGNVDRLGDRVHPGAFTKSLSAWAARGTWPRVMWKHALPIGHALAVAEDARGLAVEGRLWAADPALGPAIAELKGAQRHLGMSFAYHVDRAELVGGVRELYELELLDDVTITPRPVNPETAAEIKDLRFALDAAAQAEPPRAVLSLGSRAIEGVLRDAGLSRREAKALLSRGLDGLRDAAPPAAAGLTPDCLADLLGAFRKARL